MSAGTRYLPINGSAGSMALSRIENRRQSVATSLEKQEQQHEERNHHGKAQEPNTHQENAEF
jgi:hypothetical protein